MEKQILDTLVEIKREMYGMKQEIQETKQEIQETKIEMKQGFTSVNIRLNGIDGKLEGIVYQFEQQTAHTTETVSSLEVKTSYLLEKVQEHDLEIHRITHK